MAGFATAIAGLGGLFSMNKKDGATATTKTAEVEPEKIDISIPYNAAAMLAYSGWKGDKIFDQVTFDKFEPLYLEKAVAEVSAKKIARDFKDAMERSDEIVKKVNAELAEL
jgi:hypothetical protein